MIFAAWLSRASLNALLTSLRVSICVLPIVIGKECLSVDLQRDMRAAGVELAQFMICSRCPSSMLSSISSHSVGCMPFVDISMSTIS